MFSKFLVPANNVHTDTDMHHCGSFENTPRQSHTPLSSSLALSPVAKQQFSSGDMRCNTARIGIYDRLHLHNSVILAIPNHNVQKLDLQRSRDGTAKTTSAQPGFSLWAYLVYVAIVSHRCLVGSNAARDHSHLQYPLTTSKKYKNGRKIKQKTPLQPKTDPADARTLAWNVWLFLITLCRGNNMLQSHFLCI